MKKRLIRCSGVPEHFNYPWRQVIDNGFFQSDSIELSWSDDPSGTGSLCKRLAEGEIDIAVLLLEGAIKNYEKSNFKLFSIYVDTPLTWGVHSGAKSNLTIQNLQNPSFAISRYTSGSHLMAYVYANAKGIDLDELNFKEVGDLKGAIQSLSEDNNQLFLWEKFTTKPFVEDGSFNCIDYCPTPWPAFVIAVRDNLLEEAYNDVEAIVKTVQEQAGFIKSRKESIQEMAAFYQLKEKDVVLWMNGVEWSKEIKVDPAIIINASQILMQLNILKAQPNLGQLLAKPIEKEYC